MKVSLGFLSKARKVVADFLKGKEKLNAAQQILQGYYAERPKFEPKRPHLVRPVVPTKLQHVDKQGDAKFHQVKVYPKGKTDGPYTLQRVPTMLKYAFVVDRSKSYPYSSKRQNLRRVGRLIPPAVAA